MELRTKPERHELKLFAGVWFPLFYTVLGLLLLRHGVSLSVAVVVWAAGAVVSLAGYAHPVFIKPVYLGMAYAFFPLGWAVSHLVLLVVYYLLITPTGLILRLLGRDPLERRFPSNAGSCWKERTPRDSVEYYFRQF